MVMRTPSWFDSPHAVLLQHFLQRPTEAIRRVLVDCFNHQQHRPKLEDCGTDERSDSPTQCAFIGECGGGIYKGQPGVESVNDPYHRTQREDRGDEVGDVPIGTFAEHSPYALQDCLAGVRWGRGKIFRIVI